VNITHGGSVVHWMIGTPIRQVRLPRLANEFFQRTGRDEVLVPMEVHAGGLAPALALYAAASNAGGLISTLPHKGRIAGLVDACSPRAALTGMVNTVRKEAGRLVGDMLDGAALAAALRQRAVDLRGRRAVVLGCGGFGSAAAFELLAAGAQTLVLVEVDLARATRLAQRLDAHFGAGRVRVRGPWRGPAPGHHPELAGAQLLVQASPAGMHRDGDPALHAAEVMPCDLDALQGLELLVDAVTGPATALMRAARARGLGVLGGDEIAAAQLPLVLDFWRVPDVACSSSASPAVHVTSASPSESAESAGSAQSAPSPSLAPAEPSRAGQPIQPETHR
jgi:shikimate dehydrogenase